MRLDDLRELGRLGRDYDIHIDSNEKFHVSWDSDLEMVFITFYADGLSSDGHIVIEVEAGRAVYNNQFLKDIFQACMMFEVEYLVVAVLNEYPSLSNGKQVIHYDYQIIKTFLETLYINGRLQLPLKGILLVGY